MKLYGYWRSSATYRVRIALALKGVDYEYEPVNLLKGEQKSDAYREKNPMGLVPTLIGDDGAVVAQSLAIMEYIEETAPAPSILPATPGERARARMIAATIACEAQPFMNLRMQKYLREDLSLDENAVATWLDRFTGGAMRAAEAMAAKSAGAFCVGDAPSIADCCLVPQMYGAQRFDIDTSGMPTLNAIYERCQRLPAFDKARPENQPDAVKG